MSFNFSSFKLNSPLQGQVLAYNGHDWENTNVGGVTGATGGYLGVVSISQGPSIDMQPNPITSVGIVDIASSLWLGNKLSTPVSKDGVIDICQAAGSDYTGIGTTGNSLINLGTNTFSGPAKAVIVSGGADGGGGTITINNVLNSVVAGISHNLSGGADNLLVGGYANVITDGGNNIAVGQQNTLTNSGSVAAFGIQGSVSNTQTCLISGQGNNIQNGSNNSIINGQSNGIVNGVRCSCEGYGNQISGDAADTFLRGYLNTFTGLGGPGGADVNILDGYNNSLKNSLAHRFNQIYGENFCDRAIVCNNVKALCVGVPTGTSFDNGFTQICTPVGLESSGTVVVFGNQVAIGSSTAGEVRVYDKNIRCSVVPAIGDDYCNKTYVDALVGTTGGYSTTVNVQQIDGPWFDNFTIHCELLSPTIVTLSWQDLIHACTLNAALVGIFNPLPVQFRPVSDKVFHIRVQDDGSPNLSGSLRIQTSGYILIGVNRTNIATNRVAMEQIFFDAGTGSTCGIHAGCVTYSTVY